MPEVIKDKVERFETMGGNFRHIKLECGVVSYCDKLTVSFSRTIENSYVEDRFFEMLALDGIPAKVESSLMYDPTIQKEYSANQAIRV